MDRNRRKHKKSVRGRVLAFLLCLIMLCLQISGIAPTFALAAGVAPGSTAEREMEETEQAAVETKPGSVAETDAATEEQTSEASDSAVSEPSSSDSTAGDTEERTAVPVETEKAQSEKETEQQTQRKTITQNPAGSSQNKEQTRTGAITPAALGSSEHTVTFSIGEEAQSAGVAVPTSVTVEDGQPLSELPAPVWKNTDGEYAKIFGGWYLDAGLAAEFTTSTPVTADITLYASWVDAEAEGMYYVNFYSQDGQTVYLTLATQEGKTVNPAKGPAEDGKIFKGWSAAMQGESPASALQAFDFRTPVSEAVTDGKDTLNLYAWYAPAVKVSFISNGGGAVPTQFIAQGDTAEMVTPTRTGYTFEGWYTDEGLTQKFDFTTRVNADITLYAKWTANMVKVTLVYMYENADDADYSAAGASDVFYAPAGSYLSIEKSDITAIGQTHAVRYSDMQDGAFTGYAKTSETGNTNAEIWDVRDTYFQYESAVNKRYVNPDGSTVVLVYYNRARITLTFNYGATTNGSMQAAFDAISSADKRKYAVSYEKNTRGFQYSFTAKYRQDITAVWPQIAWVENGSSGDQSFYGWRCSDNGIQTSNMYTLESSLFAPKDGSGLSIDQNGVLVGFGGLTPVMDDVKKDYLIYARTALPGETVDFIYDGKNYTIYKEACQLGLSPLGIFGYKKLDGCSAATTNTLQATYKTTMSISGLTVRNGTLYGKFSTIFPNQIGNREKCQVLLYDREMLTLTVYPYDTVYGESPQKESYLYGDWIYNEDTDLLKTLEQTMEKKGYRFAGWYTDPDCTPGTEYNANAESRITASMNLYAKWEPNEFMAEYYLYRDDASPYATQGFAEGGKIDDKFVPPAVQKQFLGWYWYQNGVLVPFDFTSTVGAAHVDSKGVLNLYAMWQGTTGKVSYFPGIGGDNGTQEVTDPRDFKINEAAVQLPEYTGVWKDDSVPEDKSLTFVGWKAPNGKIYPSGRYVLVTRQLMQFEAQWSEDAVRLIYDANEGSGVNVTETWGRYSVVDIWDNMDGTTPHFEREGYQLIGWDENKDATEPTYKLGEGTITLSKDSTTLYAIWRRTTIDLIIEKQVTGSMGNRDKEFSFGYSYQNGDTTKVGTFSLKDDGTTVIENIPVGVLLILTETNADGYEISAVYGTDGESQSAEDGSVAFTINEADRKIVVTNRKEGVPDSGVILDTLPYMLIWAVVVVCGILFFRKYGKRRDD